MARISGSFIIGQSQTGTAQLNAETLSGFTITGSKITGTSVTFLVSDDGTNFYPLYDKDSTEVVLTTTTAARSYSVDMGTFYPWNFVKARLGTSASAVLQSGADQSVEFVTQKL
jgi:hypothetical protein